MSASPPAVPDEALERETSSVELLTHPQTVAWVADPDHGLE